MKKKERIARYGEAAYEKLGKMANEGYRKYPEIALVRGREQSRKGGKRYELYRVYNSTGLRKDRKRIRAMHQDKWRKYKNIIAPWSQIHHEWCPETADYRGVVLVEADQHMHGFIKVIKILEGKIALLTEKEIQEQ